MWSDRARSVDRFTIDLEPCTERGETVEGRNMPCAIRARTNVQQQIAALGHHIGEHVDELPCALVPVVRDI
jgi:hypothetical protein